MSELKQWKNKKYQIEKAKEFQSNSIKTDSQSGKYYSVFVTVDKNTLQYCGQEYAGAQNYHECERSMVSYLEDSIKKHHEKIVSTAIELMQKDADDLLLKAKDNIKALAVEVGLMQDNDNE